MPELDYFGTNKSSTTKTRIWFVVIVQHGAPQPPTQIISTGPVPIGASGLLHVLPFEQSSSEKNPDGPNSKTGNTAAHSHCAHHDGYSPLLSLGFDYVHGNKTGTTVA